ncbi:MAG: T9SS type A sorting domain-containing protein [Bacteroidia bacterium]
MKKITAILSLILTINSFAQAPTNWQSRGIGGGGSLFSPSINPANHNEVYIACDMGELFHSTNAGQQWGEVNFTQIQGNHDSYVCFTNNPNILYTVDYTNFDSASYIRPMKSINGGTTWTPIVNDPYSSNPNGGIERLFVDYNNPNHVVLADYSTIYFSSNGGTSFTLIHTCNYNGAGNHIAGVFFDGNNIYVGSYDGLFYSPNNGTTFSKMTTSGISAHEKMLSFSGAHEGSTVRFLCLTADSNNVYSGFQYGSDYNGALVGVYTMDNANGAWTSKMGGINTSNDYPVYCGLANNDIDTMYLAGGSNAGNPIIMKATFTTNWNYVFNTTNNQNITTGWCGQSGDHQWSYAEAFFGFEVCPNSSKIVMVGDYGFSHITTDAGLSWKQQYVSTADQNPSNAATPTGKSYHSNGMENTTNWQVMWSDSTHLFSAFSDITGVTSADKGQSWKFIPGLTQNSTYRIVKQSSTGNIYAATSSVHDMFQSTRIYDSQINSGTGAVYFSTNGGTSFSLMHNFSHPVVWLALDPSNANRMYASVLHGSTNTGGIYVTNNLSAGASATWAKLAKPPRSNGHPFNITVLNNGDLVASFCARKPTSGSNFTDSSGVYYYDLANTTWHDRSDVGMHYWTKDVIIDPNDGTQSTWYAAVFGGWANVPNNTGGVYKTINKGVSWTHISNSFRVNSVTINPTNANELYYTTETRGLWYSNNAASTSPTFSQVSSYPFAGPVRATYNPYNNNEIWVSSFGNGMMVATTSTITTNINETKTKYDELTVYPNPANGVFTIELMNANSTKISLNITNILGATVYETQEANTNTDFNTQVNLQNLAAGTYFIHVISIDKIYTKKIIINK